MADFLHSYPITASFEGGYSNNRADKGGITYRGLTQKYDPKCPIWEKLKGYMPLQDGEIIPDLEADVKQWYKRYYWDAIKGDYIDSQRLADLIFDFHVTSGQAIKILQYLLNLTEDGIFGNLTLQAVNNAPDTLFDQYKEARRQYYLSLNQPTFIKGWLKRVDGFN